MPDTQITSTGTTVLTTGILQSLAPPPLAEQKVIVEGVVGLRIILDAIFNTWRQGGDFQIIFTAPDGTYGPTVTFQKPGGHRDWAAELYEVHRGTRREIANV